MSVNESFNARLKGRHRIGLIFEWASFASAWCSLAIVAALLIAILYQGWGSLSWSFLWRHSSSDPDKAGILAAMVGSFWIILATGILTIPIGIGAAVYLEEYAGRNWFTKLVQLNIANLSGVPSVVYGILGYTLFVQFFGILEKPVLYRLNVLLTSIQFPFPFGRVLISAVLTLGLLSLPVIIIATQEALRSIPQSIRHASLALGATKWQTIWRQVLPAATPGIVTGIILSLSRALGETAPLAVIGAAAYVDSVPGDYRSLSELVTRPDRLLKVPFSSYTAMPMQIYSWIDDPSRAIQGQVAAAGIVVLLIFLLLMNSLAIYVRLKYQQKIRW